MKTILLFLIGFIAFHHADAQSAYTDSLTRALDVKSKQVEGKANYLLRLSRSLQNASRNTFGRPARATSFSARQPVPAGRRPLGFKPEMPKDSAAVVSDPEAQEPGQDAKEQGRFWRWLRNLFDSIFHRHKNRK